MYAMGYNKTNCLFRVRDSDMCDISIKVSMEVLLKLHQDENNFARYIKKILAMDLYKNRQISLDRCTDIGEMIKEEFMQYLGRNSI